MPDPAYSQKRDPENEDGCRCRSTALSHEEIRDDTCQKYFPECKITFSPAGFLLVLVKGYKLFISPLLPPCCRFYPSCSAYAAESLMRYGAVKGSILTIFRLLRCQPFCKGGYDPVPEKFSWKEIFCRKREMEKERPE